MCQNSEKPVLPGMTFALKNRNDNQASLEFGSQYGGHPLFGAGRRDLARMSIQVVWTALSPAVRGLGQNSRAVLHPRSHQGGAPGPTRQTSFRDPLEGRKHRDKLGGLC